MSLSSKFFAAATAATLGFVSAAHAATINPYYNAPASANYVYDYLTPLAHSTLGSGVEGTDFNIKYDGWSNLSNTQNSGFIGTPSSKPTGLGFNAPVGGFLNAQEGTAATRDDTAILTILNAVSPLDPTDPAINAPTLHASSGYYTGARFVSFGVQDDAIADLSTIYFQVALTDGPNYPDEQDIVSFVDDILPTLNLNLADSSTVLGLNGALLAHTSNTVFVDAISQNVDVSYYLLSWDVSSYDIASYSIEYTQPIHSSLLEAAVYQSDYIAPTTTPTSAVPEPATASLLALSGLAILARRRRA